MDFFDKLHRTIGTRGITFTKEEMSRFGIRKIYNSVSDPDYLDERFAMDMINNFISGGEICLMETFRETRLFRFSIITFEDTVSRNLFALANLKYYKGFPDLITLYN